MELALLYEIFSLNEAVGGREWLMVWIKGEKDRSLYTETARLCTSCIRWFPNPDGQSSCRQVE